MTQVTLDTLGAPEVIQTGTSEEESFERGRLSGVSRRISAIRAIPHLATWIGIAISTVGVILLVVAWGKVAGLTNVALQMPYLISAGFTGVALVFVGLTIVNIDAKRTDAKARNTQLAELRGLLAELRSTVEDGSL